MSSSSSTFAEQNSVQSFVYGKASESKRQPATTSAPAQNHLEPSVEEEAARRELLAREEGFREGELRARTQVAQEIQAARSLLGNAVESFAKSRNHYFEHVEADVVRLALTIAAKILHREAQMEPLLLRGAVRVALEKLSGNSQVTLRVAPEKEAAWRTHFMTESQTGQVVEIVPDASLSGHACSLDTAVGQIDLSIDGQLKEIEQGFFDLLARRPIQS